MEPIAQALCVFSAAQWSPFGACLRAVAMTCPSGLDFLSAPALIRRYIASAWFEKHPVRRVGGAEGAAENRASDAARKRASQGKPRAEWREVRAVWDGSSSRRDKRI